MMPIPNTNRFCMNDCIFAWSRENEEEAYGPCLKGQDLVFFAKGNNAAREVSLHTEEVLGILSRKFYRKRPKNMAVGRWFCGSLLITAESYDMMKKMIGVAMAEARESYEIARKIADEEKALPTILGGAT